MLRPKFSYDDNDDNVDESQWILTLSIKKK